MSQIKAAVLYSYRRKGVHKNQMPKWADIKLMEFFWEEAARLSFESGIHHHVDHMVPLRSPLVCGFHSQSNLAVITKKDNLEKRNLMWPDMPEYNPEDLEFLVYEPRQREKQAASERFLKELATRTANRKVPSIRKRLAKKKSLPLTEEATAAHGPKRLQHALALTEDILLRGLYA